ncbi:xylulokinase [Histomonas meleagridis]|uniref:xylulokinase n=1 Tax=Histomonas meleagridis TaxID=135588 RepID=UPI00355A4F87|nr:xylulokinase [Histomonas meleagridis]KAH0804406.1 xylulokinase [Histomonas meleagridis]
MINRKYSVCSQFASLMQSDSSNLYIGVDLGTSAVKLLLMNSKGQIKNVISKEYPIFFPHPGWSEQNPDDWYCATITGLKELIENFDKSKISGICISGQMHGLVILDSNDNVIRPAILWNDNRTAVECDYLNNAIGKSKLSEYTANVAFAGFTAPKLLWLKKNEPDNFSRIFKIMLPKDYIAYKITGVHSADVSDASGTLFFDVAHRCWSNEMCKICYIRPEQLGKVYESSDFIGYVKPEISNEFGIRNDVKVAAGAGDNASAAVGTGTVGDGKCNISLGTSGTIFISSKKFCVDSNNALHAFAHADGTYHLMGCMLSAASCNKWWMNNILGTNEYAKEQSNIDLEHLGENNIYFLPYLMGERSPHNNPNARGAFVGMTMDSTREDMSLAVLEGVAFALRDSLEVAKSLGIDVKKTRICGGGAKSILWRKIIANVMNMNVETIESEEGPALGAAMLAAVACGEYRNVEEMADKIIKVVDVIEPQKDIVEKYEERYKKFRSIYPALVPVFDVLKE